MKHYNPTISENFTKQFNAKAFDSIGDEINGIVANVPMRQIGNLLGNDVGVTATGTRTIITTQTGVKTYITGLMLAFTKDVTCDIASGSLDVRSTINGQTKQLASLPVLTLTAERAQIFVSFTNPIRLDEGVAVSMLGSFTAGNCVRSAILYGYTESY